MKRVAFYIESMALGGAEKLLIDIVNRLDDDLFDTTVISIFKESVYERALTYNFNEYLNPNIHLRYLVDNSNPLKYRLFNHIYAHGNKSIIYKMLVKDKFDIEVAFYEGMPTEFVSYSTNEKSQKYAWLHTDNDALYRDKSSEYIHRAERIYSKYDGVIGVSDYVVGSFKRYFKSVPCLTVYNGIDIGKITKMAQEPCERSKADCLTLITVGRLVPVKGYDRLLRAIGRLINEGFKLSLLMVGDGEERSHLETMVRELKLSGSVSLLGFQANPYRYFKICDAFICTSYREGMSLAFLESMCCGVPVLAPQLGGVQEIFGTHKCGVICDNNEEDIYHMIKDVLNNPSQLSVYSIEAVKQSRKFDLSNQVKRIQDIFLHGEIS